jgi:hypothetical protein
MNNINKYVFVNFGEKVHTDRGLGVVTEFDDSDTRNTKVVYKSGGFDWFNRDELEHSERTFEEIQMETNKAEDYFWSHLAKNNEDFAGLEKYLTSLNTSQR